MTDLATSFSPPAIAALIGRALAKHSLSEIEIRDVFTALMHGCYTPAQIAGFLVAMRAKGETADELYGAAQVLRALSTPVVAPDTIDIVGTGGDEQSTFNISTATMIVTSAAGVKVAKHGGRAVSSSSGSADVLEAAGVKIDLSAKAVAACIEAEHIGFMFAPLFHPAMKHAAPTRRELGIRTMFNILGPLINPAQVKKIILGVYKRDLLAIIPQVLQRMGVANAWVVWNEAGLDEIALCANTQVVEIKNGNLRQFILSTRDFSLPPHPLESIKVKDKEESLTLLSDVLEGKTITAQQQAAHDTVLANSAAALLVYGKVDNLLDGVALARAAINSGAAKQKLARFIAFTQQYH